MSPRAKCHPRSHLKSGLTEKCQGKMSQGKTSQGKTSPRAKRLRAECHPTVDYNLLIYAVEVWHRMLFLKHVPIVYVFSNISTKWVVCAECLFWRHRMLFLKTYPLCMFFKCINKMGRLRRMLILKSSPYQQMVSIRRTETTKCAVREHYPHQQICWSTKWVGRPDCSFWHHFTFLVTPITTKWATDPICCFAATLK